MSLNTLTIRLARESDLERMYEISLKAHQQSYDGLIPDSDRARFDRKYTYSDAGRDKYVGHMSPKLHDSSWKVWVAIIGERVVGYTLGRVERLDYAKKHGLFVDPEYHGTGIGSALFKISLTLIPKGTIELVVIANNNRAKSIYVKNGFREVGQHPQLFFGAQQIIMQLNKLD